MAPLLVHNQLMEPSQSDSTQAIAITITPSTNLPPPLLAIAPSPTTVVTPPPRPSSPQVELLRCNHHKLWNCFTRRLRRYLGCFKSNNNYDHPKSLEIVKSGFEKKNNKVVAVTSSPAAPVMGNISPMHSPNYYSGMNDEEREEKLKSAIVYCKSSVS